MIFLFVSLAVGVDALVASVFAAALWIAVFEALLVMTLIDIRLGVIPDEINIFLGVVGIVLALIPLALFGWQGGGIALARILAALGAGVFFALLIAVTHGKGMGMGDLKLAIPLGLIFGWPEIVLVLMAAFVIGAIVGVITVARGVNSIKGTLHFFGARRSSDGISRCSACGKDSDRILLWETARIKTIEVVLLL
jgi:prepilin signal peptidase PulO-like enzyme (type II secretory pathway)